MDKKITNRSTMSYGKNSAWMMAEYALKVVSGIFVGIYVARYLGPEKFGTLNYAIAVVTIFMATSRMGMEAILVRDLSTYPSQRNAYMSTAFVIMSTAAMLAFLLLNTSIYFFEEDLNTQLYVWILSISILSQTFIIIEYNFQSQVLAKYPSLSKSIALGISATIKVFLVWLQADPIFFSMSYALDHLLVAALLLYLHKHKKQISFTSGFDKTLVKPLVKSAWPMILAAVAGMLYMRTDQIMIKNMLGAQQLGSYSAATRIYEGWILISVVLSLSLLPAIVKLKSQSSALYESGLSKLIAALFWICLIFAVISTIYGRDIITISFGQEFIDANSVLIILSWATMFNAIGSVTARYLTIEKMEKKIAFRTFIGLAINVTLNWFLIPNIGIDGAAYATLIAMIIANYLLNYFDSDLKQLRIICNNAIFLKLRTKT